MPRIRRRSVYETQLQRENIADLAEATGDYRRGRIGGGIAGRYIQNIMQSPSHSRSADAYANGRTNNVPEDRRYSAWTYNRQSHGNAVK